MKNLILLIIALFLFITIGSVSFVYTVIKRLLNACNSYFWQISLSLDQSGNVICQDPFNDILLKPEAEVKFGNEDQTISYVLGVNKKEGHLFFAGKVLAWIINLIDKMHIEKQQKPSNKYFFPHLRRAGLDPVFLWPRLSPGFFMARAATIYNHSKLAKCG